MPKHLTTPLTLVIFASQLAVAYAAGEPPQCPPGARLETGRRGSGSGAWCVAPDLMGRAQKNGSFRHWRADGSLEREGEYVDGKRHGHWVEYDGAGRASREADYRFGQLLASSVLGENVAPPPIAKSEPAAKVPAPAAPGPAPAPAPEPGDVVVRDDFGNRVQTRKDGGKGFGADLRFENGLSTIQTLVVYAPTLDLLLDFGAFGIETQWGVGVLGVPGAPAIAAPLNPTLMLVGEIEYGGVEMKLGIGSSIPVVSFDFDTESLLRTTAAAMVPSIHGLRNLWLAMPEVPVVVIPISGRWRRDALQLDFEATSYFAIPIHGGSADLGLQLGAGATYSIDILRLGGAMHLVIPGVTSGKGVLSISPRVGLALGDATELYTSFDATVLRPETLDAASGLLWSANLGIEVAID